MAPHLALSSAPEVVDSVHRRIRRGDFGRDLIEIVGTHAAIWRSLPDLALRLKAASIVAEVNDYFGDYRATANHLDHFEADQRSFETHVDHDTLRTIDPTIAKRLIWLAFAQATVLYRRELYRDAEVALNRCDAALRALDKEETSLFGTRARLAHAHGQALRQTHRYQLAQRRFDAAIVFARRRFTVKTPGAELPDALAEPTAGHATAFEHDQLLAQWTIGKCLALGLGWIAYTTGRLSSASMLLSAGYSLLRGTGDALHRAYSVLLLGAVERARAGSDLARLTQAIALLQDGARGLADHSTFSLRARYELALAYCAHPRHRHDARTQIELLEAGLAAHPAGNERSVRWMSSALAVHSRIERRDGNLELANKLARRAVVYAEQAGQAHGEILSEALIALGESFAEEATAASEHGEAVRSHRLREHAIDRFRRAFPLGKNNPKIASVIHLHLARSLSSNGCPLDASAERAAAERLQPIVEHGYIAGLAAQVDEELADSKLFVVDARAKNLDRARVRASLEAFFVKNAKPSDGSALAWAEELNMSPATLNRRLKMLAKLGLLVATDAPRRGRPCVRRRAHRSSSS